DDADGRQFQRRACQPAGTAGSGLAAERGDPGPDADWPDHARDQYRPDVPVGLPLLMPPLTPDIAALYARTALGHVTREYPNKLDHVLEGPADVEGPRALHPVFFGSFDWHSCVHGWWTLFTLYRLHPDMAEAPAIRALADDLFTAKNVAGEAVYLARPESRGFERPYGWAWLLMLAAELERHDTGEGRRWAETLRPLAQVFAERFKAFLPLADYPVRTGTHCNTAFALRLTLDYADAQDADLAGACRSAALRWHAGDRDCQAWEPSQD